MAPGGRGGGQVRGSGRGRGGRGARGRGVGGSGLAGRTVTDRKGGKESPEPEIDDRPKETYPVLESYSIAPPTEREKAQVALWKKFRKHIHEGPLYTVSGENVRVNKPIAKKGAILNPFEDMPSYTQKYKQPLKTIPNFTTRRYCLKLFPKELWDVVQPKRSKSRPRPSQAKRRSAGQSIPDRDQPNGDGVAKGSTASAVPKVVEEPEDQAAKDDDAMDPEDDDAVSEEDFDDSFEDGDSDMAGDYNAEAYFDDGGEDEAAMDDGGEEGGYNE